MAGSVFLGDIFMGFESAEKFLKGTELESNIIICKESSATVELAAKALNTEADQIAKTVSLLVEEKPILILVSGCSKIDNKKYKEFFHTKAKMIPFDQVEELIGHAPGGVCPFGIKEGVEVYLDESLKQYEVVYPAAGSSNSAVKCTIPQLEKYSGYKQWIDVSKKD